MIIAPYSNEDTLEMENMNGQKRLPLEGKLSTKSTDEVYVAAIFP